MFEQAAQSGIQFIFVFDHTSRLLGRNWPLISKVLTGLPKDCGVLALRCSLSIDPKWPVVSGVLSRLPDIAETVKRRFGPALDSKLSNHDEKVDYLGTVFLKCQHPWPEAPGSPGSLEGSLHGMAMNYAYLISGCTTKDVIDHICGIVLQHGDIATQLLIQSMKTWKTLPGAKNLSVSIRKETVEHFTLKSDAFTVLTTRNS